MTDEIVDTVMRWAPAVDHQYGMLWKVLDRWVRRYGKMPGRKGIIMIVKNLRIELYRSAKKVRMSRGKLCGSGLNVQIRSLDEELGKEQVPSEVLRALHDPRPGPNDINVHDERKEWLISYLKRRLTDHQYKVMVKLLNGERMLDIANELGTSKQNIYEIRKNALLRIKAA